MTTKSIQKVDQAEKEIKLLIGSLKNVLTDVPYYIEDENESNDYTDEDEEYYD